MSKKSLNLLLVIMMLAVFAPTTLAAPPAQEGGQDYVVVADDWLSKLADKYLGNPFAYWAIVEYTNKKHAEDSSYAEITDPDLIEVGWKIYIPSAEEAATVVTAPPAAPAEITYATQQTTVTLDPAIHVDETQCFHVMNVYDPLVWPTKGGPPKSHLAESWEVSDDGLTYTFHLRKGGKFHDGTELTAEDVAFSMDRMLTIARGFAWLWKDVLDVGSTEVVDDYTVAFHLNEAYGPFMATLVQFFVVNKDLLIANQEAGDYGEFGDYGMGFLNQQDAGSGPYWVEVYEPGTKTVFRKFDDYWGGWEPGQVTKATFLIVSELATQKLMLQKGEVDFIEQWHTVESFAELEESPGVVVEKDPNVQLFFLSMHNQKPPLDNEDVRKAISYAFDYKTAVDVVFTGAAQARGPVPVLLPGHNSETTQYTYDMAKAREHLAASGIDPTQYKLNYVYVSGLESEERIGLLLQANLKELGFEMEMQPEPWARMVELSSKADTAPSFMAIFHTAKYPSPDGHTYMMFHPNAWGNYMSCSFYENPEVSALLEQARAAVDTEKQYELYGKAQEIVADEAAALFIANPLHRMA
ncbi:MAG: ABC transporter substrate-binding protein, partial [Anaerolineae bacterium]|nr:ABC transporter substrate-binding protein [Anaerolineae bacterium]